MTAVCAAHNLVEPSTSVKRNVTDPLGCLLGTPPTIAVSHNGT